MRPTLFLAAAALAGFTTAANAQHPMKLSDVAGTWHGQSMVGPNDSVVVATVLHATANTKGWTMTLPKGKPIPVRVVSAGGDSVVTEAGPFPSYLRAGQTVTKLHTIAHFKGNEMWGTFETEYVSGDKISGKVSAKRGK